jgi:hypothetical protein
MVLMEVLQEDLVLFGHNVHVVHAGGNYYITIQAVLTIPQVDSQQHKQWVMLVTMNGHVVYGVT